VALSHQEVLGVIHSAMQDLSAANPHFGFTGSESRSLEKGFQEKLKKSLEAVTTDQVWDWQREWRLEVDALPNEKRIEVDIVGQCEDLLVAIELKYVTNRLGKDRPSDPPAFAYDLLLDCVKLEIVAQTPLDQRPHKTRRFLAVVIGLTNSKILWESRYRSDNWARDYQSVIRDTESSRGAMKIDPGVIKTVKKNNLEGTIFLNGRHHLSLGYTWCGGWRNYGKEGFRYLMVSSYFKDQCEEPKFLHELTDPSVLPFRSPKAREEALSKRAALKKAKAQREASE
jgi:hypothetical protein